MHQGDGLVCLCSHDNERQLRQRFVRHVIGQGGWSGAAGYQSETRATFFGTVVSETLDTKGR